MLNSLKRINKIAKQIISYHFYGSDGWMAMPARDGSLKYQAYESGGRYIYYEYNSKKKIAKLLLPILDDMKQRTSGHKEYEHYFSKYAPQYSLDFSDMSWVADTIASNLSYNISNKGKRGGFYEITNDVLKKVAVKKEKSVDKKGLYKLLINKQKLPVQYFINHFGEISQTELGNREYELGGWNLIVEADAKVDKDDIEKMVVKINRLLKSKGMSRLIYGHIHVMKTLTSNVGADYSEQRDSIRIRAKNIKGIDNKFIKNFIHEIGHREWYKFLGRNERNEVNKKFRNTKTPSYDELNIEAGDILYYSKAKETYEVKQKEWNRIIVKLINVESKRKQKSVGKLFGIKKDVLATGELEVLGKERKDTEYESYFPTTYARKNVEEMFAEIFAYWVMNKLKEPAKSWLADLLG